VEKLTTFTGETILYDAETHKYMSMDGNVLESATAYVERKTERFDVTQVSAAVSRKHVRLLAAEAGVSLPWDDRILAEKDTALRIADIWDRNGQTSRAFGNALHLAMEQWFRSPGPAGEYAGKAYNLPKSKYLRCAVLEFPWRDLQVLPEQVLSDVKSGRAGRTDGLAARDGGLTIIDFKSDADVSKNLKHHELQLNFYREMIERTTKHRVNCMVVWCFDGAWEPHYVKKVDIE